MNRVTLLSIVLLYEEEQNRKRGTSRAEDPTPVCAPPPPTHTSSAIVSSTNSKKQALNPKLKLYQYKLLQREVFPRFFVYSYSHATYIDHGGVHFAWFSSPQSTRGGSLQVPLVPSAWWPCPRRNNCTPRKVTKEMTKGKHHLPTTPPRRCHEGWGG